MIESGKKFKVEMERIPVYANPGYVPSGKITQGVLEFGEQNYYNNDVDGDGEIVGYNVTLLGKKRTVGGIKIAATFNLTFRGNGNVEFAVMHGGKTRYEVEILSEVK